MAVRSTFRPADYQLNEENVDLDVVGDLFAASADVSSAGFTELTANVFFTGAGGSMTLDVRESVDGGTTWDFGGRYNIPAGKPATVRHRVTCDTLRLRLQTADAAGVAPVLRASVVCLTDPPTSRTVGITGAAAPGTDADEDFNRVMVNAAGSIQSGPAPVFYPPDYQLALAPRDAGVDLFALAPVLDVSAYRELSMLVTYSVVDAPSAGISVFEDEVADSPAFANFTNMTGFYNINLTSLNGETPAFHRSVRHRITGKFMRIFAQQGLYTNDNSPPVQDPEGTQYSLSVSVGLIEDSQFVSAQKIATAMSAINGSQFGDVFNVLRGYDRKNNYEEDISKREYREIGIENDALLTRTTNIYDYQYMVSDGVKIQIGEAIFYPLDDNTFRIVLHALTITNMDTAETLYVHVYGGIPLANYEVLPVGYIPMFTVQVRANTTEKNIYDIPLLDINYAMTFRVTTSLDPTVVDGPVVGEGKLSVLVTYSRNM